jgi:hypothetical protein
MDIRTLQSALARLAVDHAEDPLQQPKNIALSLGADAGLLLSLFRGLAERQGLEDDMAREAAADALTSILIHVAQLSNHVGLDASAALRARIKGKLAPALAPIGQLPPAVLEAGAARTRDGSEPAAAPGPDEEPPSAALTQTPPAKTAPAPTAAEASAAAASDPVPSAAEAPVVKPPARKRGGPQVIAVDVPPAPSSAAPATVAVEVVTIEDEAPRPVDAPVVPAGASVSPADQAARPEPDERLDSEAVLEMTKAFSRQLERSTRDDPVLRDLRDELETLRRSLYAPNAKKAWIAGSLRSLRAHLEDALNHAFAEEVKAQEYIRRIDALLAY